MGGEGLEQTPNSKRKSHIQDSSDANSDALGQALDGNKPGLGQDVILAGLVAGSGIQPELIAIVKALLRLDPQALRAFGAIMSVLKDASPNSPGK
jgi:hypothetical protein